MPAVSRAQQHLIGAAEHGASFPMAQKIRASMTLKQMHDFASGSMKGKPAHVKGTPRRKGFSRLRHITEHGQPHPHRNLGPYLHKAKGGL